MGIDDAKDADPKNNYEILEQIGIGATSSIYRAIQKSTQVNYAIKIISSDEHDLDFIKTEIEILQQFQNPFIISYSECYYFDSQYWICLEYCSGGSIFDIIAIIKRSFNETEIQEIISCVLLGLEYIHEQGYVHKDIKTQNMLLSSTGIVKLCDFGLVASIKMAQSEGNKDFTGTAHYMPPELINGAVFDYRADIWSVGISLIELCEGIVPNARLHKRRVLGSIVDSPSPTLKHPTNWSADLSDFLTCCLQKEVSQRSNTAELLKHRWIVSTTLEFRHRQATATATTATATTGNLSSHLLRELFAEVMTKKEELHQESLRLKEEEEFRIQKEKEEREEYFRQVKEQEELQRRQLQAEEEKKEQERQLERERVERLRRYAEEAERKLAEMEMERVITKEMETEDYHSYLREDLELTRDLTKQGWMKKRAHYLKWWNLRWVSVSRGILRYYLSNGPDDLMNERGIFLLTDKTKLMISQETPAATAAAGGGGGSEQEQRPEQQSQSSLSRYSFILLNPPLTPSTPLPRLSLLEEGDEDEDGDGRLTTTTTVISSYDLDSLTSQDFFYFKCSNEQEKNQWIDILQKNILFGQHQHHGGHGYGRDRDHVVRYIPRVLNDVSMRGWVKKKGVYGFWNQRYFILKEFQLFNYTLPPPSSSSSSSSSTSHPPRGIFPLSATCHVHLLSDLNPPILYVSEKYHSVAERNWEVMLRCETMNDLILWKNKIQKQIQHFSFSSP